MLKKLYLVRHCKSEGQAPEAALTTEGQRQAQALADFLAEENIERIISSPFARAYNSIAPLAARLKIEIETEERLVERVLCYSNLPDWLEKLQDTFDDLDLYLEGGESSRVATHRGVSVIKEVLQHPAHSTLIVTHGNLMALLLKHFDERIGFTEWQNLSNPDVFRVTLTNEESKIERIWK